MVEAVSQYHSDCLMEMTFLRAGRLSFYGKNDC